MAADTCSDKLQSIAGPLGYRLIKTFSVLDTSRFCVGELQDENGERYSMKLLNRAVDLYVERRLLTEARVLMESENYPKLRRYTGGITDYNLNEYPRWVIRPFIEGELLGDFGEAFGFDASSEIPPAAALTEMLSTIWGFGTYLSGDERFPLTRNLALPEYVLWRLHKSAHLLDAQLIEDVSRFVTRYAEAYKWSFWVFNHNDLFLGNILKSSGGDMFIIDWEHAGYGYPLFDAGLILALAWDNQEWALGFISEILKAFGDFSKTVIGDENAKYNEIYLKMAYFYWMMVVLDKAELHKGWLDYRGERLPNFEWDYYTATIGAQARRVLEL